MSGSSAFNAAVCIMGILIFSIHTVNIILKKKKRKDEKGVPYKGFFETLKIYRKLHFQAEKNRIPLRGLIFLFNSRY